MKQPMEERFKKVESEFVQLRKDYQQEKISEREFKDRLKQLRLTDKNGRCWTIGAKTGKWYHYDGTDWVEAKPPTLQQGQAICIYCGFENDIKNEACDYCGGNLTKGEFQCDKCGCELVSPSQDCPECEALERAKEAVDREEAAGAAPPAPPLTEEFTEDETAFKSVTSAEKDTIFQQFEGPEQELFGGAAGAVFPDDGGSNLLIRRVDPMSLLLFMGIFGTIVGIILGVFVGISNFFMGIVRSLPPGIQSMHGSLFGGVVYGLLGGIFGFGGMGALGFLYGLLANLVLSFFGGIKIRIDKLE
jgi:hypothetical protein